MHDDTVSSAAAFDPDQAISNFDSERRVRGALPVRLGRIAWLRRQLARGIGEAGATGLTLALVVFLLGTV